MKKILFLLLVFSFSSSLFAQENKRMEISKELIGYFEKNEYAKILPLCDENVKAALPVEKLKQIWEDLNNKCGKYQKYSDITVDKVQNYNVVLMLCHFEKMNLRMKVVFNDKNQIAGLFFIPA